MISVLVIVCAFTYGEVIEYFDKKKQGKISPRHSSKSSQ